MHITQEHANIHTASMHVTNICASSLARAPITLIPLVHKGVVRAALMMGEGPVPFEGRRPLGRGGLLRDVGPRQAQISKCLQPVSLVCGYGCPREQQRQHKQPFEAWGNATE